MKWIKTRKSYLNEAKLRDVILPRQIKAVAEKWGEEYLDYEEVEPTNKIKQGNWKLSEEDKNKVLGEFCKCDIEDLYNIFSELSNSFANVLNQSIDLDLLKGDSDKFTRILSDFNINKPKLDQILILKEPIFRKLSIPDTMKNEVISKGADGRPLKDENGAMIKKTKDVGELVFSNNLINIHSFIIDFNDLLTKCIAAKVDGYKDSDIVNPFSDDRNFTNFLSFAAGERTEYEVDFEIFNRDIYLKINHNPKDILNMSISKFYASCQHLYTGGYSNQVLGNVFDPNSIPAFLMFDTPIFWKNEKIADQLPLSRMMIRNLEQFEENAPVKIYFDKAYYDRMQDIFEEIVTKYSGNINNSESGETYLYTPDIDDSAHDDIATPYMDKLRLKTGKFIGVNTKTLHLSQVSNWSTYKISPAARIKELIVETTDLPENLLELKINLDWIKFRYIEINTLTNFNNIKTDSIAFDKCKFGNNVLNDINISNPNITKLQVISCDNRDSLDFSNFKNLEELHVIYTLDSIDELKTILETTKLKRLFISGDLASRENKPFINSLKSKGIKVEIVGPVI